MGENKMTMEKLSIRVRSFVSGNIAIVIAVLIIGAMFGGYIIYNTHVEPGTETERYEESSWSSTSQFSHSAVVVEETDVFGKGQVLENRASYFTQISPVMNGTFRYEYQASNSGDVDVTTDLSLVLRSTGEGDDEETIEYWRTDESLYSNTTEAITPGETVEVPFSVNVSAANQRVSAIEEQIGTTPGETEILVVADLRLSGDRNEIAVETTERYEASIDVSDNVYSVSNAGPHTDSDQTFGERTVEATYGPLRSYGGPLVLLGSLLGLLALAVSRWQGRLAISDDEREWLRYQSTRDEFDEWITRARIPDDALQVSEIPVETLEGLVDIAIDSNRRVIEDNSRGACLVLLENRVYRYEIPEAVLSYRDSDSILAVTGSRNDVHRSIEPEFNGDTTEQDTDTETESDQTSENDDSTGKRDESDSHLSAEAKSEE